MSSFSSATRLASELKLVSKILPPDQYKRWLGGLLSNIPTILKKKSLGIVDEVFGESFVVNWAGKRLRFDNLGFGVVREIYGHCCYVQPGELKNARNILDLGANGGAFSIFALAEAPQAKIHAVEAQMLMSEALSHNAQQNKYSERLTIETAVVGGFHNDWTQKERIKNPNLQIFDISSYMERVESCDFLKCDVEGGEFSLFQGDLDWTQVVKSMAIEYHPGCGAVDELENKLCDLGFHVRRADHGCLGYFYCSRG